MSERQLTMYAAKNCYRRLRWRFLLLITNVWPPDMLHKMSEAQHTATILPAFLNERHQPKHLSLFPQTTKHAFSVQRCQRTIKVIRGAGVRVLNDIAKSTEEELRLISTVE